VEDSELVWTVQYQFDELHSTLHYFSKDEISSLKDKSRDSKDEISSLKDILLKSKYEMQKVKKELSLKVNDLEKQLDKRFSSSSKFFLFRFFLFSLYLNLALHMLHVYS
jgi:hypothetical protein